MNIKVLHYVNFWYAQAQAHASIQTSQAPYPTPPTTTFAQLLAQSGGKVVQIGKKSQAIGV